MNAEFFVLAFTAALNPKLLALDLLLIENRRPRAMFLCVLLPLCWHCHQSVLAPASVAAPLSARPVTDDDHGTPAHLGTSYLRTGRRCPAR